MRTAAQQCHGVGVARCAQQGGHRAFFHNAAGVHHGNAVCHFNCRANVVRDKNNRQAKLALQLTQQQQYLYLHRGIQRGGGFVGQQQLGPAGQSHGDHGALTLAATELVWVTAHPACRFGDTCACYYFNSCYRRLAVRKTLF